MASNPSKTSPFPGIAQTEEFHRHSFTQKCPASIPPSEMKSEPRHKTTEHFKQEKQIEVNHLEAMVMLWNPDSKRVKVCFLVLF
jgi:hypothetical protein